MVILSKEITGKGRVLLFFAGKQIINGVNLGVLQGFLDWQQWECCSGTNVKSHLCCQTQHQHQPSL